LMCEASVIDVVDGGTRESGKTTIFMIDTQRCHRASPKRQAGESEWRTCDLP
jgi:hypothetical protein